MVSLGLEREDKLAIIGDNEPEWYFADIGVQGVGGTVVGIYTDAAAQEEMGRKYEEAHQRQSIVIIN